MTSRYQNRNILRNQNELYDNLFRERKIAWVRQYNTPDLLYPTVSEIATLSVSSEIWKQGDRFWKYAATYYSRPDLWWVIAWFNKMPSEAQIQIGDLVYIPLPLEKVLSYYGY